MNNHLLFWKDWKSIDKYLLILFFALLFLAVAISVFYISKGNSNIIQWDIINELHQKIINTPAFTDGTFSFSQNSLVYYLKSHYLPSIIQPNKLAYLFFLASLIICVAIISSFFAKEKKFSFLVGFLVIAGFLVAIRLENVFLATTTTPLIYSLFFTGLIYYFLANWAQNRSILFIFSILFIALFAIISFVYFNSEINQPLLALASYSLIFGSVIFLIYTFLIGHELLSIITYFVSSNSKKGTSSLVNYIAISLIFLMNSLLVFLENAKYIESSSYIFNPIFLFVISSILGFWGFRKHIKNNSWFININQSSFLYLGLAIGSFGFILVAFGTGNDPLINFIFDSISAIFLILSSVFFLYTLLNYFRLMKEGLPFYKVIYQPVFFQWLLARIAAFFLIFLLLSSKNLYSYFQFKAALSNAKGDFYLAEGDLTTAEVFFKEGKLFDNFNHKSNYSLASLAITAKNKVQASFYFSEAIKSQPSSFAYAGLAQNSFSEEQFFDALLTIKEGTKVFPKSNELFTNAAYIQNNTSGLDSVFIYLNKAKEVCATCETENTNLQAFWIENGLEEKLDSITVNMSGKNKSALAKITNKKMENLPQKDSVLTVESFASYYNWASFSPEKIDLKLLNKLMLQEENQSFYKDLTYLKALGLYAQNEKIDGLKQLNIQSREPSIYGKLLSQQLGMWYLQEGLFKEAIIAFERAEDKTSIALLLEKNYNQIIENNLKTQAENLAREPLENAILKAPLNPFVLERYLKENANKTKAYQAIFQATELNPNSGKIWELYALASLEIGLQDYGQTGINKLRELYLPEEFQQFITKYNQLKIQIEKRAQNF